MTWKCLNCGHNNLYWRSRCDSCEHPLPGWREQPPINSVKRRPGESDYEYALRIAKPSSMGY